jgi:hypothetical protein
MATGSALRSTGSTRAGSAGRDSLGTLSTVPWSAIALALAARGWPAMAARSPSNQPGSTSASLFSRITSRSPASSKNSLAPATNPWFV